MSLKFLKSQYDVLKQIRETGDIITASNFPDLLIIELFLHRRKEIRLKNNLKLDFLKDF